MVSGFLCPCHGRLYFIDELGQKVYADVIIHPGKNADGWWDNQDLINQLKERVFRAFDHLHPGCKGIFAFDNSQNHNAAAPGGLNALTMNLSDSVYDDETEVRDSTYSISTNGDVLRYKKGIKRVLTERKLWRTDLKLRCTKKLAYRRLTVVGACSDYKDCCQHCWLISRIF
jgi:hypothetical protein